MDTKDIEQLIQLLEQSSISEIEVSRWGRRIRVSRSAQGIMVNGLDPGPESTAQNPGPAEAAVAEAEVEQGSESGNGVEVLSPMVGTFYRSPSPEADAFVKVGDRVTPGQTLCIIEAMKIMNEVEAEISGVITDIQADNAQPVEYNQVLFIIEP